MRWPLATLPCRWGFRSAATVAAKRAGWRHCDMMVASLTEERHELDLHVNQSSERPRRRCGGPVAVAVRLLRALDPGDRTGRPRPQARRPVRIQAPDPHRSEG